MRFSIREFIGYSAASAVALATDLALMAVLIRVFHVNYMVAAGSTFVAGGVVLYVLSVSHVFSFRRVENRAMELSAFIGLGVIGLAVHLLAMYLAVDVGGTPILLAKLMAAGCSFCANFVLRRTFLFTPAREPERAV
jgi:putative flippase GtrA